MHGTQEIKSLAVTLLAVVVLSLALASLASAGGDIPDRPEALQFPTLKYDPPRAAEHRVSLKNGMVAYMVPDRTLPLVTVAVLLRLGPDQDPAGKEGLGEFMMGQLTRGGAGELSAEQLEDRVAQLGAELDSRMGGGRRGMMGMRGVRLGPTESFASINLLSKDLAEGLQLLVACLKTPAFQEDRLRLALDRELQQMKERNDDTASIEAREWSLLLNGEDHWSNRWTTQTSLEAITRQDLLDLHRRYVGPANFLLAVSGDFDVKHMKKALETAFADWPVPGERPGAPAAPAFDLPGGWYAVDKDVNQARVSFGLPAIDRYDPDWYAALVMNDILGGGGFASRLVNRIRSDEGLAYSVRASLGDGTWYAEPWRVAFQTKVRSTAYALEIALTEVDRIHDERVSEEELATAKNKFIESLPAGFETAGAIANALAVEELTGRWERDPEYYVRFRERIGAVSAADVQRVARRLLDPQKMSFLIVGNLEEALRGDPKHDASLMGLAGGEPTRLPLRDPLTMQPMAN